MKHKNIPKDIICISSIDWFPIPTRKQQLMSRLPKEYSILYVEPPITLISPLKDREMTFKLTAFLKGRKKIGPNIEVYSPPPVLPFGNVYRVINKFNQWWLSLFVKKQIKAMGLRDPLVWTYMPNSLGLIKRLDYKALVYDCVDEHSEYKGFINKETLLEMEKELLKACDIVSVTAKGLYDSKAKYNKNTYLLPNGVNYQLFNSVDKEETPVAEEIRAIKGPVIGFIGVIQEWIDLKLIEKLAAENPNWSVLMVGPIGAGINVDNLKALSNVCFVGKKKPEELPNYIKAFDVCINPFRQSELTRNVSPLKFYEYLATGKPIVTVDMPAVRQFEDCVLIADNHEDFIAKIKVALEEDTPELKAKRIAKGKESSWDNKVEEVLDIIEKELGDKK